LGGRCHERGSRQKGNQCVGADGRAQGRQRPAMKRTETIFGTMPPFNRWQERTMTVRLSRTMAPTSFDWHGARQPLNDMHNHTPTHTLSDFDFELPYELIAQHPAPERSGSRLLDARSPTLQ